MKNLEFYSKYKTSYPPLVSPFFSKENWWRIGLITLVAVLIEPLIMYKHQRSVPLSFDYYLRLVGYFVAIVVPFVLFLLWINWRESLKRSRGYGWVGKFEVIDKQSSFVFCYLLLSPGIKNTLKVNRAVFHKIRIGDVVQIRRDALGSLEEISRVNNFSSRVAKAATKRNSKTAEPETPNSLEAFE